MTALHLNNPDLLRDCAFINGAWMSASQTIEIYNPADASLIGTVPDLGTTETLLAVSAAHEAFSSWKKTSAKERATALRCWSQLMLDNAHDLARLMTAEQGKPLTEAAGEVAYAAAFLDWFAEEARRVNGAILTPHQMDRRLLVQRSPVGVVAAVTPWNFPLAMITRKAAPALAAGCTMVLKPSELTPLSALALARLAEEAGVPHGVFNVVTGAPGPIGEVFTADPRVRKFTFTGSTSVGKQLSANCMATVKRVSLELGGNAPFIVFDDADLDAAVEGAIASKFRNTGQTCVCANRFYVQHGVYEQFAKRLAARVARLEPGAGLNGPCDQGPLINAAALAKVERHVVDATSRGATALTGAMRLEVGELFYAPTVLRDVPTDALICREETFGPVAGLVKFNDEEEVVRLANDTSAGLAAYVFTRNLDRFWRMTDRLEYGMVGFNTGLISTEVAPFGGVKESGFGREGSSYGMEDYLDIKLACLATAE